MLQPPRELRDTFDLLALLDATLDLDRLIERIDWSGVTPQQVCYAVLGRLPQDLVYSGLVDTPFVPPLYFRSLLLSPEFQTGIVPNLLGAFPEKPRRFFVHVPRSGGSSLGQTLAEHACTVPYNSIGPDWCSGRAFLEATGEICRGIRTHDSIHVSGHYTLRSLVDGRLARFGDSIWTSVRAPRDLLLSFMNYVMTILQADPDLTRPDTRHWAGSLGLKAPLGRLDAEQLRAMLPRMLEHDQLLPKDLLCHFLGDGTAASALDLLAAADVEIIDASRLDSWREQRWKGSARRWANVSGHFLTWDGIGAAERRQIDALLRQDSELYRTVAAAFGEAVSVRGLQLARAPRPAASSASGRIRRAARPILLDPEFTRFTSHRPDVSPGIGWADPPLHYRTVETTLQFPLVDARIRVRYARRRPERSGLGAWLRSQNMPAWRRRVRNLLGRLNARRAA